MEASPSSSTLPKKSFIRGSQPLWKAFWVLYVLGSLSFTAISLALIKTLSASHALLQTSQILNLGVETTLVLAVTIIIAIYIMYFLFCLISVWRCSINTMKKYWALLARFFISINFAWISWKAFFAFGSLVMYFSNQ